LSNPTPLSALLVVLLCWMGPARPAQAQPASISLDPLFADHAVLQRDKPIPVWGHAPPGDQVSVSIAGHVARARTDRVGHWRVMLPAMHAGGPFTLTARGRAGAGQTAADIL